MSLATGSTGQPLETAMPVHVHYTWSAPAAAFPIYIAPRAMFVSNITGRVLVGASGATATIKKAASGTAGGSGTAVHSGTLNLNGTADTNQALTMSTTPANLKLAAGDSLSFTTSGTTTGATGVVTIELIPEA